MEKIVLTYKEFLDKVRRLREAKDENGNAFYSDIEIARYFGRNTVEGLNKMIVDATTGYRKEMIGKIKRMLKEKYELGEIERKLGLNGSTIRTLLNDMNDNIEKTKNAETERVEALRKDYDDMMKDQQELLDKLGLNDWRF